jgi:hypothetical protein
VFAIDTLSGLRYAPGDDYLAFAPSIAGMLCGNDITSRLFKCASLPHDLAIRFPGLR